MSTPTERVVDMADVAKFAARVKAMIALQDQYRKARRENPVGDLSSLFQVCRDRERSVLAECEDILTRFNETPALFSEPGLGNGNAVGGVGHV